MFFPNIFPARLILDFYYLFYCDFIFISHSLPKCLSQKRKILYCPGTGHPSSINSNRDSNCRRFSASPHPCPLSALCRREESGVCDVFTWPFWVMGFTSQILLCMSYVCIHSQNLPMCQESFSYFWRAHPGLTHQGWITPSGFVPNEKSAILTAEISSCSHCPVSTPTIVKTPSDLPNNKQMIYRQSEIYFGKTPYRWAPLWTLSLAYVGYTREICCCLLLLERTLFTKPFFIMHRPFFLWPVFLFLYVLLLFSSGGSWLPPGFSLLSSPPPYQSHLSFCSDQCIFVPGVPI